MQEQSGAVKKDAAKQSRIKSIARHFRWLVRTRSVCGQVDWYDEGKQAGQLVPFTKWIKVA